MLTGIFLLRKYLENTGVSFLIGKGCKNTVQLREWLSFTTGEGWEDIWVGA